MQGLNEMLGWAANKNANGVLGLKEVNEVKAAQRRKMKKKKNGSKCI
jgi:hypothetical protein